MQVLTQGVNARKYELQQRGCFAGKQIAYKMVAQETILDGNTGKPAGSLFSYSYICEEKQGDDNRPVVFAYNGGPGSGCLWLNLGFFGPRRVKIEDEVNPSPVPPYELEDNPFCLLPECDIVLVDPVGCGYGRLLNEAAGEAFYGTEGDADAVAAFIEWWLEEYGRRNSPVYLAGESYGTVRTCMLLRELCGGPMSSKHRLSAIPVAGVILMGTVLEGLPGLPETFKVPETALQMISMAAVHWHHHMRESGIALADWVEEVWSFTKDSWLPGWFAGEGMKKEDRKALACRLEHYTGVDAAWWEEHHLEISAQEFSQRVLADEGLDVGLYDGRYTMKHPVEPMPMDPVADDPAMGKYTAAFCAAQALWKREMGLEMPENCRPIDFMVNGTWNYRSMVTPLQALKQAMRRNEKLRILFCSGLMDLVTPPGRVRFLAHHLGLDRDRVTVREYPSGHMPYLGDQSASRLMEDIRSFIRAFE